MPEARDTSNCRGLFYWTGRMTRGITNWILLAVVIITIGTNISLVTTNASLSSHVELIESDLTHIKGKLEMAYPSQVLSEVRKMYETSKADSQRIKMLINTDAPWVKERSEWQEWRESVEKRLAEIGSNNER